MAKKQTSKQTPPPSPIVPDPVPVQPRNPADTVNVPRTFLQDLSHQIEELKKSNEMLLSVADRKAVALFYQRNNRDLPKEVKLRVVDGKVVVGWRTTRDEVYQDPVTRVWREYQDVELILEDGTQAQMPLLEFNRKFTYVVCRRTGIVSNEETGDQAFKLVRLDNGQEYTIGVQFVN